MEAVAFTSLVYAGVLGPAAWQPIVVLLLIADAGPMGRSSQGSTCCRSGGGANPGAGSGRQIPRSPSVLMFIAIAAHRWMAL